MTVCNVCGNEFDPAKSDTFIEGIKEYVDRYEDVVRHVSRPASTAMVEPSDVEYAVHRGEICSKDCFLDAVR